jgi:hypothetical protein
VLAHDDDTKGVTAELEVVLEGKGLNFPGTLSVEGTRKPVTYFRFAQQPRRGYDFKGCRPFVLHGRILRDGTTIWADEMYIYARCGKPKKLKATFECTPAGCMLSVAGKQVKPGERLFASFGIDDARERHELIAKDGVFTLDKRVFAGRIDDCAPSKVTGEIVDGDDQVRWEDSFTLDAECFEREFP